MSRFPDRQAGFTLAEMLVALALLGLMTTYALGALGSFRQMARVTADVEVRAEVEAAARHLRQTIADARAVFGGNEAEERQLLFAGRKDRLTLMSVLNDRLERGGLYALTYQIEGRNLILRRALHRPDVADTANPGADIALLRGVESVGFSYCAAVCPVSGADWLDQWASTEALPKAIKITVTFSEGDSRRWPVTVIPVAGAN